MKALHIGMTLVALVSISLLGCPEEGEEGTAGIDCGEHGSEHNGHCHCHEGYLFDGEICVEPGEITDVCEEHEEEEGEEDHHACVCPEDGDCPCDGEIVTFEEIDYCEPELH